MADRTAPEIARDTLKLLGQRRLLPTPENFAALYHEIAGTKVPGAFPTESMGAIARALPAQTPGQQKAVAQFEAGIAQRNWATVQAALVSFAGLSLLATPVAPPPDPKPVVQLPADIQEQVARLVDQVLPAVGADDARLQEQGQQLLAALRSPQPDLAQLKLQLANFAFRLSFAAEDQEATRAALLRLLQLVFQNIAALGTDDAWLAGQAEALVAATAPPLSLRGLDEVQARLKDVIWKQTEAKARHREAEEQMRQLLAAFIERLSQITDSTSAYAGKIGECARQVEGAARLQDIGPVLQEAIGATRLMSAEARQTHAELHTMREKTRATDAELQRLQQELDTLSQQSRHDPLTGALNRRGLDEATAKEAAVARRRGTSVCVALLDIDNFKRLNDRYGHATGDAALVHLAGIARQSLRPQDTVARYGGEEFVVMLPDTGLADAIESLKRVQRALTTELFMQQGGGEKMLITFSAGVAELGEGESPAEAIARADKAMYLAKRQGKNRVLAA